MRGLELDVEGKNMGRSVGKRDYIQILRRLVFTCLNRLYTSPGTYIKLENVGSLLFVSLS